MKNFRYLVTCIVVFSHYAWSIIIKKKLPKSVLDDFKIIIRHSGKKPNNLKSDQRTEFLNTEFKEYLTEIDMGHFNVNSELKASEVERSNRTMTITHFIKFF
jgi:hypothetical protein